MQATEIYVGDRRWYRVNKGRFSEDFPSVNTILSATESVENNKRLANWKFKQAKKFFTANRKCINCLYFAGDMCVVLEKLRSPITKKHRCKSFALNAEMEAAKVAHGEAARDRGTTVHKNIQDFFTHGTIPTCKYASQIVYLLSQLAKGNPQVEQFVFSAEHGYGGRCDLWGEYLEQSVVIDWVTTDKNYFNRDNFERKFLQCAGYAIAIKEMGLAVPTEVVVVAMSPTTAELYREPLDKWAELWLEKVEQFWETLAPSGIPF